MKRTSSAIAAVAVLLALTACSSNAPSTSAATSAPASVDRTAELQAIVADVESAVETEPGRLEVKTTIVDPRGDAGSEAAQRAIAICEAAVTLGPSYVSVLEGDGTTFVVYGHPSYGDACTEV